MADDDPAAEVAMLRGEVAYLQRALEGIGDVLPYRDAKQGGCAHARRLILDAIGTSQTRFPL